MPLCLWSCVRFRESVILNKTPRFKSNLIRKRTRKHFIDFFVEYKDILYYLELL